MDGHCPSGLSVREQSSTRFSQYLCCYRSLSSKILWFNGTKSFQKKIVYHNVYYNLFVHFAILQYSCVGVESPPLIWFLPGLYFPLFTYWTLTYTETMNSAALFSCSFCYLLVDRCQCVQTHDFRLKKLFLIRSVLLRLRLNVTLVANENLWSITDS